MSFTDFIARAMQACLATFVATALLVTPANAASIVGRSVADMTQRSDVVVHARVVRQDVEMRENVPWTKSTLQISEALKGKVGTTVEVWQQGGTAPDGVQSTLAGDMELATGDEIVIFLAQREGDYFSFLLGWSVFNVDRTGRFATVRRNQMDLAAYIETTEGLRPLQKGDLDTPVTFGDLRTRVLEAVGGAR